MRSFAGASGAGARLKLHLRARGAPGPHLARTLLSFPAVGARIAEATGDVMASRDRRRGSAAWTCALALGLLGLLNARVAEAASFTVQITENTTLGGTASKKRDVVLYDSDADSATLLLSRDAWNRNTKMDVFQQFSDGSVLVSHSHKGTRTIGGLDLTRGDVVRYDPQAGTATIVIDGSEVPPNTQLFAVWAPALLPGPPGVGPLAAGMAGLLLFPRLSRRRDPAAAR